MPELHLGITPWRLNGAPAADDLCHQAELAEQWGYQSFFLPESHFTAAMPVPDPMLLLAATAARTRKIQLGTTSWLLPIRHPVLAAEQVACLDQLCAGRLILGLGRGYSAAMLDTFGVDLKSKRERFDENLATMLAAWRGEPVGADHHDNQLYPLPLQQPHPPLWVAAFGPKAIAQVGRLGLPYLASPVESLGELEINYARHAEALAENGQSAPATVPVMRTVFLSEDARRCESLREKLATPPASPVDRGSPRAVDDWCLVGNAAEVRAGLAAYRERLGVTHLIAVRPRVKGIPEAWNRESLQAFAAMRTPG